MRKCVEQFSKAKGNIDVITRELWENLERTGNFENLVKTRDCLNSQICVIKEMQQIKNLKYQMKCQVQGSGQREKRPVENLHNRNLKTFAEEIYCVLDDNAPKSSPCEYLQKASGFDNYIQKAEYEPSYDNECRKQGLATGSCANNHPFKGCKKENPKDRPGKVKKPGRIDYIDRRSDYEQRYYDNSPRQRQPTGSCENSPGFERCKKPQRRPPPEKCDD